MLGWLKRKAAPVPGESPDKEESGPAGDQRLGRLLGRLGSDAAAGEHAGATLLDPQPEPPPHPISPADLPEQPEDPAEAVLKEIYPPAPSGKQPADDAEKAARSEVDSPILPADADNAETPETEAASVALDPAAASQSAAEAAAVIADIERIVGGEPSTGSDPAVPDPAAPDSAAPDLAAPDSAAADAAVPVETMLTEAPVTRAEPAQSEAAEADVEPPRAERAVRRRGRRTETAAAASGGAPLAERASGFAPMFVIAVASQKGGAGKTTLAAHLAVRAGLAGHGPVVLIDTDPQGSLAEWWHARAEETPALAVVTPEKLAANLAELRGYGTAVAVIDTPPALTGSIEQVIAMADLIVIPVRPSPHDLRAAGGTVDMARRAGKPFLFVVNGAAPRASITAQAVAALSEHGRVAPVILYQRTEYAASMIDGRTVVEAAASGRSAQEIAELWQCVSAQIGMRAAA